MSNVVYIAAGQGREFAWKSDDAFVKLSSEDSGGMFSLIEDNLTTEFRLARHVHREHAETFVMISGKVEFMLDDSTVVLSAGDTLHIPPGEPHAVRCLEPAKMLTLYQPAGLEKLFAAYAAMTSEEMADQEKIRAVDLAHDNVVL
jgi:quercetin 2,3-dioxygenase